MRFKILGRKGSGFPWLPVVSIFLAVVAIFLLYSATSGKKYVQQLCYRADIQQWIDCSKIPFQAYPSGTVGTQSQTSTPAPTEPDQLSIKDLQILVQEPYSESWSAYAGTASYYMKGTNAKDPTATAFDTTSITSGSGSETSWNKAMTDTEYIFVLNGGGTYYDKKWEPFYFLSKNYNKNLGTYTLTIDSKEAPAKVGTFETLYQSNQTYGVELSTSDIQVNHTQASGLFTIRLKLGNSASNTALYDVVLDFQSDVTYPMEGNEFSAVTLQHQSGSDFGLPSDIRNYVANEVPIPVADIVTGGQNAVYDATFTYSSTNFEITNDKLHIATDDLGGWLNQDVLPANKGATASAYYITRVAN